MSQRQDRYNTCLTQCVRGFETAFHKSIVLRHQNWLLSSNVNEKIIRDNSNSLIRGEINCSYQGSRCLLAWLVVLATTPDNFLMGYQLSVFSFQKLKERTNIVYCTYKRTILTSVRTRTHCLPVRSTIFVTRVSFQLTAQIDSFLFFEKFPKSRTDGIIPNQIETIGPEALLCSFTVGKLDM